MRHFYNGESYLETVVQEQLFQRDGFENASNNFDSHWIGIEEDFEDDLIRGEENA